MKKNGIIALGCLLLMFAFAPLQAQHRMNVKPWDNGRLKVSENGRYLVHENGTPFFWLGDTGWLLTSRLQREEADFYLKDRAAKGFNVIQVSVFHYFPQYNIYGECATPNGYDFKKIDKAGYYGYWNHVDYIVEAAAKRGMYIAMVCTWGSEVVRNGHMNAEEAAKYGRFLAERYKDCPNIIWLIGGDVSPEPQMDVWHSLARSIKSIDNNHLMTYHPIGRTCSDQWFHDAEWLDFNMFQSGHRRYGQHFGEIRNYPIAHDTEEDNWQYVERAYAKTPVKPVIDGEPSYEAIPKGLRSGDEPYWNAAEIRRYAYWSVFSGSFGHTYGHNSVMQFYIPSIIPSFFPTEPWWEGLQAPGAAQMQYLKRLMTSFPFTEGMPDQSMIVGDAGSKHDRLAAIRGKDYAMVYTYTNRSMEVDLGKISGAEKEAFWFSPADASLNHIGRVQGNGKQLFTPQGGYCAGNDKVLVLFDASAKYIAPEQKSL